jgi:aldehyde dehydrogenase (NAD+)
MSKPEVYKNFINGKWVESKSGETTENRNPADTNEIVGVFQKSNSDDVNNAISAASEAYKKWRLVPAPKRGEILYRVATRLERDKEAISRDMTREMGKVIKETRGDTQEAIDMTYYMAGEGRRMEFPDCYSIVEDDACFDLRKYYCYQTCDRYTVVGCCFDESMSGGRYS